jgi:hypothetical protein
MDMAQRQGYNDFEEYKRPVLVQKFDWTKTKHKTAWRPVIGWHAVLLYV